MPLATILAENDNSLLVYFRKHHNCPESTNTFGIHPQVMDTYVKSCGKLKLNNYISRNKLKLMILI